MKKELFTRFNQIQIAVALGFHLVFCIFAAIMMKVNALILLIAVLVADALYLIYWIAIRFKSYMPWIVYAGFAAGGAVELLINLTGIIPKDNPGGWFKGIGQLFYEIEVGGFVLLLGIINLAMFGIYRLRIYLKESEEDILAEIEEERAAKIAKEMVEMEEAEKK